MKQSFPQQHFPQQGFQPETGGVATQEPAAGGSAEDSAGTRELVIDVRGLVKSFQQRRVVDDFSLQVRKGEIFGFLGPNGSGKTTTIRLLCGLLTPDAGEGTCLGFDILRQSDQIKRQVGYMTQRFSFYEDLSIAENLDFVARVYGLDRRRQRVAQAVEELGLGGRQHQLAGSLSGGWKQRLALAACVLHQPRLLLLDEPTAGVDPRARREFWDHLHRLADDGLTVLVSTHYMDEAERCHQICYLAYGRLMARGRVADVIAGSGLHTWEVRGSGIDHLARQLDTAPPAAVGMVARFGSTLHLSGSDRQALEAAIAGWQQDPDLEWTEAMPTLEDVFIHLMGQSTDNFAHR